MSFEASENQGRGSAVVFERGLRGGDRAGMSGSGAVVKRPGGTSSAYCLGKAHASTRATPRL